MTEGCSNARNHSVSSLGRKCGDARDVREILGMEITTVVDLALEEPPFLYPRDTLYCRVPLLDGEGNLPSTLRIAIQTITTLIRLKVPTLVACPRGNESISPPLSPQHWRRPKQDPPMNGLNALLQQDHMTSHPHCGTRYRSASS